MTLGQIYFIFIFKAFSLATCFDIAAKPDDNRESKSPSCSCDEMQLLKAVFCQIWTSLFGSPGQAWICRGLIFVCSWQLCSHHNSNVFICISHYPRLSSCPGKMDPDLRNKAVPAWGGFLPLSALPGGV